MQAALTVLLEAYESAEELRRPAWDFAVDIQDLRAAGLPSNALRSLLCQGYLEHGIEKTPVGAKHRAFRRCANLTLTEQSCFVLSEPGLARARELCRKPPENSRPDRNSSPAPEPDGNPTRPGWDAERRELRCWGEVVKRFRQPAPEQEAILAAFEEEGWPPHIDDPLSPQPGRDAKDRLHQTIHNLNHHQQRTLIRFQGDGNGRGVHWSLLMQS